MLNKIVLLTAVLALSGCATTSTVRVVVVEPPAALYNCPRAPVPPKSATLTNQQVADYISELHTALVECNVSMEQIQQYVTKVKKIYNK